MWERGEATGADVQEMLARPATASPTGYAGHEDGGRLGSLSDQADPAIRYFSGIATYTTSFEHCSLDSINRRKRCTSASHHFLL